MKPTTELLEEAARRHLRETEGPPDATLDDWLDAALEHRLAYAQVCAAWFASDAEITAVPSAPRRSERSARMPLWALGFAMLMVAMVWGMRPQAQAPQVLADGVVAKLSSNAQADFNAANRRLLLTRGRAWIDVNAADGGAAIEVEWGAWRVRDIGTRFVVDGDRQRIAVYAGAVELSDSRDPGKSPIRIGAGEAIDLNRLQLGPVDALEQGLDRGQWILVNQSLGAAIAEIEREGARVWLLGDIQPDSKLPNLILPDRIPATALRAICAQMVLHCRDLGPLGFVMRR